MKEIVKEGDMSKVVISYKVKRTINTGNYENVVIEYGIESEESGKTGAQIKAASEVLKADVEAFMEKAEQELRSQLGG